MEIIALLLTVLTLAVSLVKWRYSYWTNMDVPTVPSIFPYGSIKGMGTELAQFQLHKKIYETFKKNSSTPFVGLFYYLQPVVLCTDMELIKNIFTRDSGHFTDRGAYYNEKDQPISAHIFNLDNPKWKTLRTKLTPTFTSGKIKMMFHTVCDVAEKFVKKLEVEIENSGDGMLDMREYAARFTTDVIGKDLC